MNNLMDKFLAKSSSNSQTEEFGLSQGLAL